MPARIAGSASPIPADPVPINSSMTAVAGGEARVAPFPGITLLRLETNGMYRTGAETSTRLPVSLGIVAPPPRLTGIAARETGVAATAGEATDNTATTLKVSGRMSLIAAGRS